MEHISLSIKEQLDKLFTEKRLLLSKQQDELTLASAEVKSKYRPLLKSLKGQINHLKGQKGKAEAKALRSINHLLR